MLEKKTGACRAPWLAVCSALSLVVLRGPPARAEAPSFDCKRAEHEIEILICQDQALAALDRKMAVSFRNAHENHSQEQKHELDAEQRSWIKGRNDCWKADDKRACTEAEYTRRQVILEARYGLAMVGTWVTYACGPDKTEVIFTPVGTQPKSANLVRGEKVQTLILQPGGLGTRYEGDFALTFVIEGDKATLAWSQDASLACSRR